MLKPGHIRIKPQKARFLHRRNASARRTNSGDNRWLPSDEQAGSNPKVRFADDTTRKHQVVAASLLSRNPATPLQIQVRSELSFYVGKFIYPIRYWKRVSQV